MRRVLIVSRPARADLANIRAWFSQPGAGQQAAARLVEIGEAVAGLVAHPSRFPVGDRPGLRESPVAGHRIVYRVDPDTNDDETAGDVLIVRVFGPGQSRRHL